VSHTVPRSPRARWLAAAIALAIGAPAAHAAARPHEPAAQDRFIVRFKAGTPERNDSAARQRALDAIGRAHGLHLGQLRHLALGADVIRADRKLDAAEAKALMLRLARDPRVDYVEPDRRLRATLTPNDTSYTNQWHYYEATAGIGAPAAWDVTTGTGTVVAVIDTGITNHSDLNANVLPGYDFISDPATANDGGGRDADPSDPGDFTAADECTAGDPASNSSWHGTHVAGTVAAVTNNAKGVAGVAFGAKVMPLRVLGKCGGSTSDIADAIVWAAGGSVAGVPANTTPAEVINMSLGGPGACDRTSQDAIDFAVQAGTVVVVAAGNDGDDARLYSPASCQHVVSVGAVGRTGARSSFSNYGPAVDLSAPGSGGIMSTLNSGTTTPSTESYGLLNGTSMASPHVAGVAALLQSVAVHTPALVETILKGSARAFPVNCLVGCGTGLLTAPAAITAAQHPFLYVSDPAPVLEGAGGTQNVAITVNLSEPLGTDVTFDFATADGTATAGSDYTASTHAAQVIPAGQTAKTFNVAVSGDTTAEPDETFLANVSNVTGITALDTQATATIVNDEAQALANGVPVTGLSATTGTQTLYKIEVPAGATNLTFTTTGSSGDADLYVKAGWPPTVADFDCASQGPDTTEGCSIPTPASGTWYLMLNSFAAYSGVTLTASYTAPPPAVLTIADASVAEGNSGTKTLVFTVKLSKAAATAVTYNIATSNGGATAGSDYVASSLSGQSIPAGTLSKTFNVTLNGDTTYEANEGFVVSVTGVSGATVGDGTAVGTILNDDGPALSIGDVSVTEGNAGTKQLAFTVTLAHAAAGPVTYSIATASGSATSGSDFVGSSLTGETIPAGQTSRAFNVTLNGDTAVEANETLLVNLSAATGATILDGQATGTVLNDDGPTLSIADVSVAEGNAGTKAMVFTVKLSQAAAGAVTYNIATVAGTATAGSDYVASSLVGQSIPAGQTSKTFSVTVNGDATVEANEGFVVLLSAPTGATLLDDRANGTLLNDDGPTVSIADVSTIEGNSGTKVATFTVKLSQAAAVPVTYNIATANSSAIAGNDYVAASANGETIPAGMLSKTFSVTINGDTTVEGNDTFFVNLSSVAGATVFDGQAAGVIVNDEGPRLSIDNVAVTEGNSGTKLATFTVSLAQAAAVPVTYNIATVNATATAGSDYVARSLLGETIPAGMLSRTFDVTINGDGTVEPSEQFYVTVTNATGASIYDGSAVGTITNDD
jgi:serine protease